MAGRRHVESSAMRWALGHGLLSFAGVFFADVVLGAEYF